METLTSNGAERVRRVSQKCAPSCEKARRGMLGKGGLMDPRRIAEMDVLKTAPFAEQHFHPFKRGFCAFQIDHLKMPLVREVIVFRTRKTIPLLPEPPNIAGKLPVGIAFAE